MTYIGNTTLSHGILAGTPFGKLTLAPGERLISVFGTCSDYVNSLGFTTDQGLTYGLWGNYKKGSSYQFNGPLTGFFGGIKNQGLVALGVWASDGSELQSPPPPSPSPRGGGFDVDEPCPETQLLGSGIDVQLIENQVRGPRVAL